MKLNFPTSNKSISLAQAINIFNLLSNEKLSDITKTVSALSIYTGHPMGDLVNISVKQLNELYLRMFESLTEEPSRKFKRDIKIDGVEYRIIPNFDEMNAGEFMDIDMLSQESEDNKTGGFANFNKILAILYRPVVLKSGELYKLKDYIEEPESEKKDRERLFLKIDFDTAKASVGFFLSFIEELGTFSKESQN